MSFFEQRMRKKQAEIDARNGVRHSFSNPEEYKSAPISELMTSTPLPTELTKPTIKKGKKKAKFIAGDTKEEIIENIIEEQPSIKDVKDALKQYIQISEEAYIDN